MKGSRELKSYVSRQRRHLAAIRFDSLLLFKLQSTCKKWRKTHRKARDGSGAKGGPINPHAE